MNILKYAVIFCSLISIPALARIPVAITVDDLPKHGNLPLGVTRVQTTTQMIKALQENQVPKPYGFINAARLSNSDLIGILKLWREAGFPLGNHTFSHPDLNKISVEDYVKEIQLNENSLRSLSGDTDWHFFRYPFLHEGNTLDKRESVRSFLNKQGYKIAEVTIDFNDWAFNDLYARCMDKKNTDSITWLKSTYLKTALEQLKLQDQLGRALFGRPIKHVLLLHIGGMDAVMADQLFKLYKDNDVEFITLDSALNDPIYAQDSKVVSESGIEFTYQIMRAQNKSLKSLGVAPAPEFPEQAVASTCE